MKRRRRGALSPEDRTIWEAVARTVKPLKPAKARRDALFDEAARPAEAVTPQKPAKAKAAPAPPSAPAKTSPKPALKPLAPLDRRLLRRVGRGARAIEARLDLHGLRQSEAHIRLGGFLRRARADGLGLVLVITGKGAGSAGERDRFTASERGVLRRLVPQWLAAPDLRDIVAGFETAAPAHGGEGAFYVRLRGARSRGD